MQPLKILQFKQIQYVKTKDDSSLQYEQEGRTQNAKFHSGLHRESRCTNIPRTAGHTCINYGLVISHIIYK